MDQIIPTTSLKVKVAVCQQPLHEPLSDQTLKELHFFKPDFVSLPEHYPLLKGIHDIHQAASVFIQRKRYLESVSAELSTVVVGGTLTESTAEGYYNTCYVFDSGKEIGSYRKVYPTAREQEAGVLKGNEFKMFEIRGIRAGVLICADVLFEESFQELSALRCDLVFVPTASPYREAETMEEKFGRDQSIFVEGSRKLECPLIKTCGVGTTFGHPIQGRSLIATPQGVLTRAEPHQENDQLILFATL